MQESTNSISEAFVYTFAVKFLSGQLVHFSCIILLLLVVTHAESSASTSTRSGNEEPSGITKDRIGQAAFSNSSSSQRDAVPPPAGGAKLTLPATLAKDRAPDWDGIKRDTGVIVGGQVGAVVITYFMPQSFSAWTPEQKKAGFDKYKRNFVNPVMDKDKFYINYALHPYWGATYYTRARERGLDREYAVAYSALLSAAYEFGVECIAERPSIQDIIVTPLVGSLMGALIEPWRDSIKRKEELRWYDHTALVLTDPLGVLCLGVEKMFGIKSTIMVDYAPSQRRNNPAGTALASSGSRFGVALQIPFN